VPLTSLDVGKWSKHVEDDDQAYNDYHVGNPGCQKPTMTGDGFDHPCTVILWMVEIPSGFQGTWGIIVQLVGSQPAW